MTRCGVSALLLAVPGCAWYAGHERYGMPDPARNDRTPIGDTSGMPWHDVKAVLDNRCVVCHGCYDVPCQLQLGYAGMTRGANKESIYATRLS